MFYEEEAPDLNEGEALIPQGEMLVEEEPPIVYMDEDHYENEGEALSAEDCFDEIIPAVEDSVYVRISPSVDLDNLLSLFDSIYQRSVYTPAVCKDIVPYTAPMSKKKL